LGQAWRGPAWQARRGAARRVVARRGLARLGTARQARRGEARRVAAWQGMAGLGKARQSRQGLAWQGKARYVEVGHGTAGINKGNEMGQYIPEKHKTKEHLWQVEMIFDQSRPLEAYSKLQVAETATEAIYIVLGMKKPEDITEVRAKYIAPESYDLIRKDHGRDTTKKTRYRQPDFGVIESAEKFSRD